MTLALSAFRFDRLTDDSPFGTKNIKTAVFIHPLFAAIGLTVLKDRSACFTYTTGGVEQLAGVGPALKQYWTKLFWFHGDLSYAQAMSLATQDPGQYAAKLMASVVRLATPIDLQVSGGTVPQLQQRLDALADLYGDEIRLFPSVDGSDQAKFEIGGRIRTARPAYLKHLLDWHRPQAAKSLIDGTSGYLRHSSDPVRAVPSTKTADLSAHETLERHRILQSLYDTSGDFFSKAARIRGYASIEDFSEFIS